MGTITESVDVDVDLSTAYNQWTQFETFPQFMEGVEDVQQISDTQLHWVTKVGPVVREFDAVITEQHPDELVAWESVNGPEHAGRVTFRKLDDSTTQVTAQMTIDPDGFVENVGDKAGIIDARVAGDLKRFKSFIEGRGSETGAWRGEVSGGTAAAAATATAPTEHASTEQGGLGLGNDAMPLSEAVPSFEDDPAIDGAPLGEPRRSLDGERGSLNGERTAFDEERPPRME